MAEGILAQQTPHHGTEKEKKKTDDTGQYEKYRPGIGPHLFDFRDDPHQEFLKNDRHGNLLVGIGIDRRDGHKPASDNCKPESDRDCPLQRSPVTNGLNGSHSGTSSQDNVIVRAAKGCVADSLRISEEIKNRKSRIYRGNPGRPIALLALYLPYRPTSLPFPIMAKWRK